jgi:hypothetical protein
MAEANNVILGKMLERLYASLLHGPSMNCRVHNARQRVDLAHLARLDHLAPTDVLARLMSSSRKVEVLGKVPPFRAPDVQTELSEGQRQAKKAADDQNRLVGKLRDIAEDARDYEQDTGENALYIGYPLLSLPPNSAQQARYSQSARVLAPLAFLAVDITVKRGTAQSVGLAAKGAGIDLLIPNYALLAWLEQQTGRDTSELFADEDGSQPFLEINAIARLLADALHLEKPPEFSAETTLLPVPRAEELGDGPAFLASAVLGLFPISNQGLLRDVKAMLSGEALTGPVESLLAAQLRTPDAAFEPEEVAKRGRIFSEERLVTVADPCQARAVRLSKGSRNLVIHGPPGTGKSQTITNIIGDHLARGERVLMVCDKRTALDVVRYRLEHLGLGSLCAVVHDPERDQRTLYMKIREQLDALAEAQPNVAAAQHLAEADQNLQKLHLELTAYFAALSEPPAVGEATFHELVGEWFALAPGVAFDAGYLRDASLRELEQCSAAIREVLDRGVRTDYPRNPWADAAGLDLASFLSRPTAELRQQVCDLAPLVSQLDSTAATPSLGPEEDLAEQARLRDEFASVLHALAARPLTNAQRAWREKSEDEIRRTLEQFSGIEQSLQRMTAEPLETEFLLQLGSSVPSLGEINTSIEVLRQYREGAQKWYGFLLVSRRSAARQIAAAFGQSISPGSAERLLRFFEGLKARSMSREFQLRVLENGGGRPSALPNDDDLISSLAMHREVLQMLHAVQKSAAALRPLITAALASTDETLRMAEQMQQSAHRARLLASFISALGNTGLFAESWTVSMDLAMRTGETAGRRSRL